MRKTIASACLLMVLAASFPGCAPSITQKTPTDESEFLRKAKATYYSIRNRGLKRFECQAIPDWTTVFSGPKGAAFIQQLQGIRYSVTADFQGELKVTAVTIRPSGTKIDQPLERLVNADRQQIEAFFEMWLGFFLIIDDLSAGKLQISSTAPKRYVVSTHDTELEFDGDYTIKKMSQLPLTTKIYALPAFVTMDGNLRFLTKVEAVVNGRSLHTSVQYHDDQGFKLPSKMVTFFQPSSRTEVTFTNYHLN
jgi:hypothetical protein